VLLFVAGVAAGHTTPAVPGTGGSGG
jgi:hypothetical protein